MAINATDALTNPRTAAPPTNPLKSGLYSIRDFVRKGQEKEYANTLIDLMTELSPKGVLEECYATEIMKSTWRLRRCRNIEFDLAESNELDPMIDPKTSDHQRTVDRARAQSHFLLRHSLAQLSKLQTARTIRLQFEAKPAPTPPPAAGLGSFCNPVGQVPDLPSTAASFCNPAPAAPVPPSSFCEKPRLTPRNAQCPCGSGNKYKRCCGKDAPPVLNQAA
jgi:hypothetical protein